MTNHKNRETSDLTLVPVDGETGSEHTAYDGGFSLLAPQESSVESVEESFRSANPRGDFQMFTCG